jgi:hypothetical protein
LITNAVSLRMSSPAAANLVSKSSSSTCAIWWMISNQW